ncbi:MAG: NAD(+)/NADH kinase [Nitrososphaerota archaeon]|nr:NAD(+)/NADH kinase [Nitrososphaerota archaeon]
MKAKLLLDSGVPKVPPDELKALVAGAGIEVGDRGADFGIVVGGDGRFSRYGRTEDIPLLFVGVRSNGVTGSRAHMARVAYDELPDVLQRIKKREYSVEVHKRLAVSKNGKLLDEVFTDVYLQRGSDSTCIRYKVVVAGPGISINEVAIGDGVVVSTQAGASGYYSYLDRIKGDSMDPRAHSSIAGDEVGVCHVSPTFTEREGSTVRPLRYRVPWESKIRLSLFRMADARLYGASDGRAGVKVELGDEITIGAGKKVTRLISFDQASGS